MSIESSPPGQPEVDPIPTPTDKEVLPITPKPETLEPGEPPSKLDEIWEAIPVWVDPKTKEQPQLPNPLEYWDE